MTMDMGDEDFGGMGSEYILQMVEQSLCDADAGYENCKATVSGNKIIVKATITDVSKFDDDYAEYTYKELKEELEDEGYTCK